VARLSLDGLVINFSSQIKKLFWAYYGLIMRNKSSIFRFDDVEVREREFTLIKAGKVLTVEPKAFRALLFLLHNPQRVISKEECRCFGRLPDAVHLAAAPAPGR
jgi:hypothetical protein